MVFIQVSNDCAEQYWTCPPNASIAIASTKTLGGLPLKPPEDEFRSTFG